MTKIGGGTLALSGANTYSGTTIISSGILNVAGEVALGSSATITLAAGTTLQAGGAITLTQVVTLLGNGTIDTNGNAMSIGGTISGSYGLTKISNGTLTLVEANTYTGETTITTGTLALSGSGAIATSSTVNVIGAFDISEVGFSATINDLIGSGTVNLGSNTLTAGTAASTTYSGAIIGSGNFTKAGSGTLTLSGVNTLSGEVAISTGTLALSGSGSIAASSTLSVSGTFNIRHLSLLNNSGGFDRCWNDYLRRQEINRRHRHSIDHFQRRYLRYRRIPSLNWNRNSSSFRHKYLHRRNNGWQRNIKGCRRKRSWKRLTRS